ncbi:hypothetical protein ACQKP8_26820 [Photobacterium alginatilyticum]|uniref:hypothetical protein n=1 Tax=Photobacterium alginatilyticum TaxID=1775171 RepID=UPI0040694D07
MGRTLWLALCVFHYLKVEGWELSFVTNSKSLDLLKEDYDEFLRLLEPAVKRFRRRTNIRNTKLWQYKKSLDKLEQIPETEQAKLLEIVNRYTILNRIMDSSNSIKLKDEDLFKMVEGAFSLDDKDQKYNDAFLELSMAARFATSNKKHAHINMGTICDVVIDDVIAIECKYIHKENNLNENISYAIEQIDRRIKDGLAQYGMVAIDMSNLIDRDSLNEFSQFLFSEFYKSYPGQVSDELEVAKSIVNSNDFSVPVRNYFTRCVEAKFIEHFIESATCRDMNINTKGILIQVSSSFCIYGENIILPVPLRMMTHFINPKLSSEDNEEIKNIIGSLCSGI